MKASEVIEHMSKNVSSLGHSLSGILLLTLYHNLNLFDSPISKSQITLILTLLQTHSSSDLSLCRSGCSLIRSFSERPETQAYLATPDAIRVLVPLLHSRCRCDEEIATSLCTSICELVFAVESLQGVLLKCGGADALLEALAAYPSNDVICKAACDVLVYLSSVPGVSGAMCACIPGITKALGALVGDAATCGCLCEMLCHVLAGEEGCCERVKGVRELVDAVLGVVRMYENDVVVSGLACQVLGIIVQTNETELGYVWGVVENDPALSKFIGNIF